MKLRYEVCKVCFYRGLAEISVIKGYPAVDDPEGDEEYYRRKWNHNHVPCQKLALKLNPQDNVPEDCPYYLEHLVSQ